MGSSQNQFYFHFNKSFRTIFIIDSSIDYLEFEIQRRNFEFWDKLNNLTGNLLTKSNR